MGARTYSKDVGITFSEAQKALEQYRSQYVTTFEFAKNLQAYDSWKTPLVSKIIRAFALINLGFGLI